MPPVVIAARGVNHAFGTGQARAQVLFGVDFEVHRGEFVVLKGASGSGKTTLLTLLACLREIQAGEVTVLGERLDLLPARRQVDIRRRLGFIFQAHNLYPALTAMQNVRMGLELQGRPAMDRCDAASAHVLGLLGLGDRLHHRPAQLSGGQKQRVAIARALVGNPQYVFADEPTAALDADSGGLVVDLLRALGRERGTTTLVVTHDPRVSGAAPLDGGRIAGPL